MAARKEKKSLRGRKTRQQEKKRKACGKGKPGSKKRKEKLAGKENQRINKKQSLPARGRKPMRQWRRLREEEGEDTEQQVFLFHSAFDPVLSTPSERYLSLATLGLNF